MAKQDDWIRITLRLPPELHERLTEAAKLSSMNAEIVSRLEDSFEKPDMIEMAKTLESLIEFAETVIAKKDQIDMLKK